MKKKLLFITVILISILTIPNVYAKDRFNDKNVAKECNYIYDSYGTKDSRVVIHIYNDNSSYAWITKMNGDSHENDEDVQNWSSSTYTSNGSKCPPYVVAETSWGANVYAYWDKNAAIAKYNEGKVQDDEIHLLGSTTSEEDWGIKLTDIYALNNDYRGSQNEDTVFHGTATKTCTYSQLIDGEVTSGTLTFYDDGTHLAEIVRMNGNEPAHNSFKVSKVKNYNNIKSQLDQEKCPYYMIADVSGINEVDFAFDKNQLSGWNLGHDTRLIALTTKQDDYDPQEDGGVKSKEERIEQQKEEIARENVKYKEYNPEDPYNGEAIGDNFCSTKEVVQALKALGIFVLIAKFAIPIIIIAMGTLELVKVVVAGDEATFKKQLGSFGKRVVLGLAIFFVPTILNAFLSGLNSYKIVSDDANQCQQCLLDPFGEGHCVEGASSEGSTPNKSVELESEVGPNGNKVESGDLNNNKSAETGGISNNKSAEAGNLDNNKSANAGDLNHNNNVNTQSYGGQNNVDTQSYGGQNNVQTGSYGGQNNVQTGDTNNNKQVRSGTVTNADGSVTIYE